MIFIQNVPQARFTGVYRAKRLVKWLVSLVQILRAADDRALSCHVRSIPGVDPVGVGRNGVDVAPGFDTVKTNHGGIHGHAVSVEKDQ